MLDAPLFSRFFRIDSALVLNPISFAKYLLSNSSTNSICLPSYPTFLLFGMFGDGSFGISNLPHLIFHCSCFIIQRKWYDNSFTEYFRPSLLQARWHHSHPKPLTQIEILVFNASSLPAFQLDHLQHLGNISCIIFDAGLRVVHTDEVGGLNVFLRCFL